MKKIILIIIINCSLLITNCLSQWVQQTSSVTSHLYDCDFIDQNTGWVCGINGIILKTTNGGLNWLQQNSGVSKILYGIDAVDENIVYCVGFYQTILKSTNGGNNWLIIRDGPSGTGASFSKAYFLNQNTGWLLRDGGGYVLKTTNGCTSFDSSFINNSFTYDIFFKDANSGVLCGDAALVMKSTDGGMTWNQVQLPLATGAPNLYRISFVGDFGWTVGEGGPLNRGRMVWRTTNFGSSWDSIGRVPYPSNALNYSVFFSSLNIGWAGGTTGYTFKTTNGGYNWLQQTVPSNGFRNDIWFYNDSMGWSIGGGGLIFNTINGGTYVSVEQASTVIPNEFKLYQNYPNPFNNETVIEFDIPWQDYYFFKIYDVIGREIETVFNEYKTSGTYKIKYNNYNLTSGVYFYTLYSKKYRQSKRFVLIK